MPEIAGRTRGPIHRVIDGTLVFADLSGFTALSERLAALGGKAGAEEMTAVLNEVFGELLDLAAVQGGEMLKYGGDAVLLLFRGEEHAARAVNAARNMQRGLTRVGNIVTDLGRVRLRMSVGVHSGPIDFFVVGPHRELVVAGEVPTTTAAMESAADAGEILLSPDTAALLPPACLGEAKGDGVLLARMPSGIAAPGVVERSPADLSKFIPKALRSTLAAGPVQSEHRPATIGFALVEFDESASLEQLHETFERIEKTLATFDVTFLATDLAGGGVKIITAAGLPIAQPDAEERMVRAARAIVEADLPLPVRFGIQRGHVFAGTVGPPYRMAYTVIGDVVNTAARLIARAEAGEVLTLEPVLEQCSTEFAIDELAPFVAKGKAEPLNPLRVGVAMGQRRGTDEVLPLVGREAQVAIIDEALNALRAGRGAVLDIVGEAGMGKSRVVDELVAHADDLRVIRTEAHELDSGRAYGVAALVLRELFGVDTPTKLRQRVRDHAPELAGWAPVLGVAFGFDIKATTTTARLAPQAVPAKIREVTVALVRAAVKRRTVVLVEDLHWSDAPSARLLQALGSATENVPILITSTRRAVEGAIVPVGITVEVTELADDAAGEMLDRLCGRPLLPNERAALLGRAGGNPMFLRELAVSIAGGMQGELPDRVESLIKARIDRLEAADREVLRAASVVGRDFSAKEVSAALGETVAPIVWDRLASFVAQDSRLRFRHALIRDSAYEGLPFRTRRQLHQRVGGHLEARADAADNVERLAVHFAAAGDGERAWRYGAAAGDRARGRFAYAEAAMFYGGALGAQAEIDDDERFRVVDSQSYCLQTSGSLGAALEAIRRGRRSVRNNPDNKARLWLQEATCQLTLGEIAKADNAVQAGLRLMKTSNGDRATHVRLLVQRSQILESRGQPAATRRLAIAASTLAEEVGDKPGLAHALAARFKAETSLRLPGRAEIGARARELFEELGQEVDSAVVLTLIGNDLDRSGDFAGAVLAYDRAEELQARAGLQLHAAVTGYNRAELLLTQGRFEEAAPLVRRVLDVFIAAGYPAGRLAAACLDAQLRSAAGDPEAACAQLRELAAEYRGYEMEADAKEIELVLAETFLIHGDLKNARLCVPDPTELATESLRSRCARAHAVIAARSRNTTPEAVRLSLENAIRGATDNDLPYAAAVARLLRARLFREHADEAGDALAELDRMGVVRVPVADVLVTA